VWVLGTGRSCLMPGLHSLKTPCKLSTKFPFKSVYFFGIGGLTTSSYWVYVYTSTGHMDLWRMYVMYIQYIYISIQYNYLFLMQYKCKRFTFIVLSTFHSNMTVVVLLLKQTLPISDCWHLILSKRLALFFILSVLPQIVCTLLWVSVTLWHMSTISSLLITSDFSSIVFVFHHFSLWLH
jgi:hypothetical protein